LTIGISIGPSRCVHVCRIRRYERIEGAGHWMQLTAPDKLNPPLLDHL
jgi:hypothetical protein